MACMTSGASSVTLQSLYWRSSDNFSVPAESSRVNWCSPARRLEDEILESVAFSRGGGVCGTSMRSLAPPWGGLDDGYRSPPRREQPANPRRQYSPGRIRGRHCLGDPEPAG